MSADPIVIHPQPAHFGDVETVLATAGNLTASTFRYSTGVAALRIRNELGHIVLLPFQGQQIWDAEFLGRRLTMGSIFDEPVPTADYLRTYGAFFIHCGATAMGNPGPQDRHPLHGELPNANYESARLLIGSDGGTPFMALTGTYRHRVAYTYSYVAEPKVRLASGDSRIEAEMSIRNLRHSPMELMYLAHINFRPADGARLVDAVPNDATHIKVRTTLPGGLVQSAEHRALIDAVVKDPASHRRIESGRRIDPELVMTLTYPAAPDGWAHTMQLHPDGSADFVGHRPKELGHVVRWMSRTGDEDALGMALPATAGADGYAAEKAKGNVKLLAPQTTFRCRLQFGALMPEEAAEMQREIEALRAATV
jgi:hypothetical protein